MQEHIAFSEGDWAEKLGACPLSHVHSAVHESYASYRLVRASIDWPLDPRETHLMLPIPASYGR
jgi:hypothetical protein